MGHLTVSGRVGSAICSCVWQPGHATVTGPAAAAGGGAGAAGAVAGGAAAAPVSTPPHSSE
ncbi:MAG TPA: hypothetical protein EYM67_03365 [Candidatus Poseidoniales archaeon]|nr:hypothetical protein [Candidatus Poseidoniales archaeon]